MLKYVAALENKGLIHTENTVITTRDGCKRNGSLRYTIRPIQEALDMYYERQMAQLKQATALEGTECTL